MSLWSLPSSPLLLYPPPSPSSVSKISLIIACIIGVIAYRLAVYAAFASIMKDSPTTHLHVVGPFITPQLATSVTASCINFVIIMILNLMYERVAIWITDMGESQSPGGAGGRGVCACECRSSSLCLLPSTVQNILLRFLKTHFLPPL